MRGRNPFEEIERIVERMSEQFEESAEWPARMRGAPAVDVLDRDEEYEVVVDLPGFRKDDVELTLTEDTLRVSAEREDGEDEEAEYVRQERPDGSVERRVTLPEPVDEESAAATLADGVLRVTLAKQAVAEDARTIDIE